MDNIVEAIDQEIARLNQARTLLLAGQAAGKRRGRPVGNGQENSRKVAKRANKGMSAEGRARVAAAMRARWAKARTAAKKAA